MLGMSGPVCDACTVAADAARLGGGNACMEPCALSDDCGVEMFCCPNYSVCMDRTTAGGWGENCDAHDRAAAAIAAGNSGGENPVPDNNSTPVDPGTDGQAPPTETNAYTLIGESE